MEFLNKIMGLVGKGDSPAAKKKSGTPLSGVQSIHR